MSKEEGLHNSEGKSLYPAKLSTKYKGSNLAICITFFTSYAPFSQKVLHQMERVIHLRKIHEVRKQGNPTKDTGNPVKGIPGLMLGRA